MRSMQHTGSRSYASDVVDWTCSYDSHVMSPLEAKNWGWGTLLLRTPLALSLGDNWGRRDHVMSFKHCMGRSGGRAVERRTVNREDGGSIPSLGNFVHLTLPVCFGRDTKSRWSLLSGVYARGSKISHTGGKCVTCSGLTNSIEGQLWKPSSIIL